MELERLELLASIAKLYYQDGMTQSQIASRYGYSRSMISRFLNEVRENNIVDIRINYPLERNDILETGLIEQYKLKVAWVLTRRSLSYEQLIRRLGILAARLLDELVGPCMTIGISWGAVLNEIITSVSSKPYLDIHVVQLTGTPGISPDFDGHALVQRLARTYGGNYSTLLAPLFVDSETTREALLRNKQIQTVLQKMEDMDIALAGIGDLTSEHSSLIRADYLSVEDAEELAKAGAVGHICGIFFDAEGNLIDHSIVRKVIGVSPQTLRSAPIRIGVAGGQQKIIPVLGAVRAGFVNVLITDDVVANALIRGTSFYSGTRDGRDRLESLG